MPALLEYKCPCCGGAIAFNSEIQKMKCPYCDTEFDVETLSAYDEQLKSEKPDKMQWNINQTSNPELNEQSDLCSYICHSCGGEIVGDKNTAATTCPFCGNPVVVMEHLSGLQLPDLVIPFKLDKKAAIDGLVNHLKGKRLLPKVFKNQNHIEEVKGIYIPFWLFDADAHAAVRYRATKVKTWSDSQYNYTETSHYSVFREGDLAFHDVPVDGSSKAADDLMESIEPFDISQAVDFQTAYLAGYFADKYDVSAEESIKRANERIKRSTEEVFADTVTGFATVSAESSSVALSNGKTKYALYPVWLLNTKWKEHTYTFAMNGQTGKFVGNLPVDWKAWWRWFLGLSAIGTAAAYAIAWLIHLL